MKSSLICKQKTPDSSSAGRTSVGIGLLAAALALPTAGPAHAESIPERGMIGLKTMDYQERQEDQERIHIGAT